MRRLRLPLVLAVALTSGLASGIACSNDDGGDLVGQLQACGLLTEGELPESFNVEFDSAEEECAANCFLALSCAELEAFYCEIEDGINLPQSFLECGLDCYQAHGFVCGDGTKISNFTVCDGEPDCADGSDEEGCPSFDCADGNGSYPPDFQCDGFPDCADGSDEVSCPAYACADGEEVMGGERCDGNVDCADGSDEDGCAEFNCPG